MIAGGCAALPERPPGAWLDEREALFAEYPRWSVRGRLGLSDGERGGSLAVDWRADGTHHQVGLRTLAGGRQWRLEFGPGYAVLEGSEVGQLIGTDPEPLVEEALGWSIPVSWMARWVRGLPAPEGARLRFAPDGSLARLDHPPWVLEFQRWREIPADGVLLPVRLQATSGSYRVRAVLSDWVVDKES